MAKGGSQRSGGCLLLFLACAGILLAFGTNESFAQIIPDNTLGSENSVVTNLGSGFNRLDGGAIRGSNLFHSFQEFNIAPNHAAYFSNPNAIENIFSRVTGSNPSHLFGTLGVLGNANLYFLNPNGIIFGPDAKLDLRGSLITSTAEDFIFPDGSQFGVSQPQAPSLLKVNVTVPIGLQVVGKDPSPIINSATLNSGGNLTFVGGTITSTGQLNAPQGKVSIATVSGPTVNNTATVVHLNESGQALRQSPKPLSFESQKLPTFASPSLADLVAGSSARFGLNVNSAGRIVLSASGTPVQTGDIAVSGLNAQAAELSAAHNLILENSQLNTIDDLALVAQNLAFIRDSTQFPLVIQTGGSLLIQGTQGVDVFALNHSNSQLLSQGNLILRSAAPVAGDAHYSVGGNFRIEQLDGRLGHFFSTDDPIIRANGDITFDSYTGASLHILAGGSVTVPGSISITGADNLGSALQENIVLSDGSTIVAVDGSAQPTLDIRAGTTAFQPTGITPVVPNSFSPAPPPIDTPAAGADIVLGEVVLFAPDGLVLLTNQYEPNSSPGNIRFERITTVGTGTVSGDVFVDSRGDITIQDTNPGAFGSIVAQSRGVAGDITLFAQDKIALDNSALDVSALENGDAGAINLQAGNFTSNNVSQILANTEGQGNAGQIEIIASGAVDLSETNVSSQVLAAGIGESGSIRINVNTLNVVSSQLAANTQGRGDAGLIEINADRTITLTGSSATSQVLAGGIGNSQGIEVNTGSLTLREGSQLSSSSFGQGNAGLVKITATETVLFDGGVALSQVGANAVGNSGGLEINANILELVSFSSINANSLGEGDAGLVKINAPGTVSLDQSSVLSQVIVDPTIGNQAAGNSGGIDIHTGVLQLTGSQLSSSSSGQGDAGLIKVIATDAISLNFGNVLSQIEPGGVGSSGGIEIHTGSLELINSDLATSVDGSGNAGDIKINATGNVRFGTANALTQVGSGITGSSGNIVINAGSLELINDSQLNASHSGQGDAGDISIDAQEQVLFDTQGNCDVGSACGAISQINAGGSGNSGSIIISADQLSIRSQAQLRTSNFGQSGRAGNISVATDGQTTFEQGGAFSTLEAGGIGTAGAIDISAGDLSLTDGSQFIASSFGQGAAGNVTLKASNTLVLDNGEVISLLSNGANGSAGDITITAQYLTLLNNSQLVTSSFGQGNGGNISITAPGRVSFDSSVALSQLQADAVGEAGDININTDALTLANGSDLNTNSAAQGSAGSIKVTAIDVALDASTVQTQAETDGTGNSGDIEIHANSVALDNSSQLLTNSLSEGDGGSVKINATDQVVINQSNVSSQVEETGQGASGSLILTTGSLNVIGNSQLNAGNSGQGDAGDIDISATQTVTFDTQGGCGQGDFCGAFTQIGANGNGNAGMLTIAANQLTLNGDAQLRTSNLGQGDAGSVRLEAAGGPITLDGGSIFTTVEDSGVGNAGDIVIFANQLAVTNDSQLRTSTLGQGDSGAVQIDVTGPVALDGGNIFTTVEAGAFGNAGDITVNAGSLEVTQDSQLLSSTFGRGNAGNISITARDFVLFDAQNQCGLGEDCGAFTQVERPSGVGSGGIIAITTDVLTLRNGSSLTTSTFSVGDAGNLSIDAREIFLDSGATLRSTVEAGGVGAGGNIEIANAERFVVTDEAALLAQTLGQGNAGNINISTNLFQANAASLTSSTAGQGRAGNINITASDITLDNQAALRSTVEPGGVGQGGDIVLSGDRISITGTSALLAQTFEQGNAGNIRLTASESVLLNANSQCQSEDQCGAFTQVEMSGVGIGGNIDVTADVFQVLNGSSLTASTFGQGASGQINIDAREVTLDNQATLRSTVEEGADGNGGEITLTGVDRLNVIGNSAILAQTMGQGNAGRIKITARDSVVFDAQNQCDVGEDCGAITRVDITGNGDGGLIEIDTDLLQIVNGSSLTTSTFGNGDSGDIFINASTITIANPGTALRSTAELDTNGATGSINITGNTLSINDFASLLVDSFGTQPAGDIYIEGSDLNLDRGTISATTLNGDGGNINIDNSQFFILRNLSQISTTAGTANAGGDGGNIYINQNADLDNAGFIIAFPWGMSGSDITANAFTGNGGSIIITTQGLFGLMFQPGLINPSDIPTNDITVTSVFGLNGNFALFDTGIDPTQGLEELPSEPADPRISESCVTAGGNDVVSFFNTGKGGLPPSPDDLLGADSVEYWIELILPEVHQTTSRRSEAGNDTAEKAKAIRRKRSCPTN